MAAATPRTHALRPRAAERAGSSGAALYVRISLFALFLTAFWTPLNTLLLPGIVEPLAPRALRGTALGTLTLVGVGIAVLAQPLLGAWSDRMRTSQRRRLPIVAGALVSAPLAIGLWAAPTFAILLGIYIGLQCAMNFAQAAFQAVLVDIVDRPDRAAASAAKTGLDVAGNAIGLGVAGALIILGAGEFPVLLCLAVVIAAGAGVAALSIPPSGRQKESPENLGGAKPVFAPLWEGPKSFRSAVLARFLFFLGLFPVQRFVLYLLEDRYAVEDPLARASLFIVLAIFVAAAAGFAVGKVGKSASAGALTRITALAAAGALLVIAFSPTLVFLAVGGLALAATAGAFQALNWAALAKSLPDAEAARYFGLANVATAGASALSGLFGPLVDGLQAIVPGVTYQVLFTICAIVTALAFLPSRRASKEVAAG